MTAFLTEQRMKLNYSEQGSGEPVVLMHGLFGSQSNLGVLARELAAHYWVISVDLRNHGLSPQSDEMNYPVMAADIIELLDELQIEQARLVGHSMGGKVGMQIALSAPQRVRALVVADIAPVTYRAHHDAVLDGLELLWNEPPLSRAQAAEILQPYVAEELTRAFLLKNLYRREDGRFGLKINLPAILENYTPKLSAAPEGEPFSGPVLFVKGELSAYIQEKHRQLIVALFPAAQLKIIPQTGHWLHAEKPQVFNKLVARFLAAA